MPAEERFEDLLERVPEGVAEGFRRKWTARATFRSKLFEILNRVGNAMLDVADLIVEHYQTRGMLDEMEELAYRGESEDRVESRPPRQGV
jgi:hypothetical protein